MVDLFYHVIHESNQNIDLSSLDNELKEYSLIHVIKSIASLLLNPHYQENTYRLEMLLFHTLKMCSPSKINHPTRHRLSEWLNNKLHKCVMMEDPAEDVFVLNVRSKYGDFLIIPGLWESIDTALISLLDVLKLAPEPTQDNFIAVYDMLRLSTLMIKQAGLSRWECANLQTSQTHLDIPSDLLCSTYYKNIYFTKEELNQAGISFNNILQFCIDDKTRALFASKAISKTDYFIKPLYILDDESILIVCPQNIGYACKHYILSNAKYIGQLKSLIAHLNLYAIKKLFQSLNSYNCKYDKKF